MPYSMYKRLRNVNELTPTRMTLQLVDCNIVYHKGILSDVALRIDKLVVPSNFVIMDIPEEKVKFLIRDVLSVGEEKVEFAIRDVLSAPIPNESMYLIDISEDLPFESKWDHEVNALESFLEGTGVDNGKVLGWEDPFEGGYVDDLKLYNEQVLVMNKESSTPPEVEMKTLHSSLKYAFLGANSTYPVIVNSELNGTDLDRLVNLVQKHRKAIGYTINDIKGISSSICTHRINLGCHLGYVMPQLLSSDA